MSGFNQLSCMRSFLAVAEAGSFTRAAHAIGTGPASVSEHVATLERHLDIALFQRTTRSVRLTEEGASYLEMCRDVLRLITEADRRFANASERSELSGTLTLELSEGVDDFLFPALSAFQQDHPAIILHVRRAVRQFDGSPEGADIAIRSVAPGQGRKRDIVARPLGESRTIFLAAPAYLERFGAPTRPEDLLNHRCIGYIDAFSGRLWEWYFANGDDPPLAIKLPCKLAMAQGALRRRAAVEGLGVINDIDHYARSLVKAGRLVPVLEQWSTPQAICHLLHRPDRHRAPRVSAFIDHLHRWFAEEQRDPA